MLEAIAIKSVEASREVSCAYFGNIGRNSGDNLLSIFLVGQPNTQLYRMYESTTLFFGDIVGFTKLTAQR